MQGSGPNSSRGWRRLARRRLIGRGEAQGRFAELERRVEWLGERAAAAEAALAVLARRPLDSIAPTMAWIEQATLSSSPLISVVLATRNRAELLRRGDRVGARPDLRAVRARDRRRRERRRDRGPARLDWRRAGAVGAGRRVLRDRRSAPHLGRAAIDAEIVRRRARAARGLGRPAEPPAGAGELLRSLHDPAHPLELDGWALSAPALERLLALVPAGDPLVVECGSGESTIAIARLLRARGRGRLQALEHYPAWAARSAAGSRPRGSAIGPRSSTRRSRPTRPPKPGCEWYSPAALERLGEPIDLLLVDGPPGGEPGRERSRYPALPGARSRAWRPGRRSSSTTRAAPASAGSWSAGRPSHEHPVRAARRRARGGPGRRPRFVNARGAQPPTGPSFDAQNA